MGGTLSEVHEQNGYDAFGNRISANTSVTGAREIPIDPSTNRLVDRGFQRFIYDDRGNLTEWWIEHPDPEVTTEVKSKLDLDPFDMIERLREDGDGVPPEVEVAYVYTADDERIATFWKVPAVSETWTLRGLDGKVIREFFRSVPVDAEWRKDTIHRQGQVLATETAAGREDAHVDHLGTIRLWTGTGASSLGKRTYTAFGEEIMEPKDTSQTLQFTGHERDRHRFGGCSGTTVVDDEVITKGETFAGCDVLTSDNTTVATTEEVRFVAGDLIAVSEFTVQSGGDVVFELNGTLNSDRQDLDYMHARFCHPGWGKFLSVDPVPRIDIAGQAPQLWNLYTYAANNPLRYIDPNGEFIQLPLTCVDDDQCDELVFLRQTLVEAGASDVAEQLQVSSNGRVVLDSGFEISTNSTVRKLATAINLKDVGTRLTSTTEDLSAFGGAKTSRVEPGLFEIRINKGQVGNTLFLFEGGVEGFLSGGEAIMHELGHFMATSGALSNAVPLGSRESNDNALLYENLHRQTRGGARASLERTQHDSSRQVDE